jgi:carboxypeptidase Taq
VSEALANLKARLGTVTALGEANALLEWDMQCYMPPGGSETRARQMSVLSRLAHEIGTADETGKLLEAAERDLSGADYDSDDASLLRVVRRDYDLERKLPADFVAELVHTTTLAHEIWAKARAENNFKAFAPILKQIVDLKIRQAEYLGYTDHIYDALLNQYEPGMKTADVQAIFVDLRKELVPLVQAIRARVKSVDDSLVHQDFDEAKQRAFGEMVVQRFGYDFNHGRQDVAVHPFTIGFSSRDVRITTRFDPHWLNPALFGTFHEAGHAMYEQGVDPALDGGPLSGGTSLGVHESQSRLWENVIGRSRGFWTYFYPQLQAAFPAQLGKVSLENFYRAINKVEPSLIRVEADEVTYNLHIMVRLELEIDLISGKLKVENLPEAWNAKYKEYLGVVPPTDALGVLQDVHWSGGMIGYFSTYSLGNLVSVQLYDKAMATHPAIPAEIAQGQFGTLLGWLRQNVHRYGRKYEPKELVKRATGEPMQSRSYMRYLKTKYGEIYGL